MAVKIFFCYAHEDEALLGQLKRHLKPLQREGLIDIWHDRDISAGTEWEQEIHKHLNEAQIILLLISPDFMNSEYCYSIEMKRAIERHVQGDARVIPVILRYTYWQGEPLGKLQALPKDVKPVKSWPDEDEAFFNVAEGVRTAALQITSPKLKKEQKPPQQQNTSYQRSQQSNQPQSDQSKTTNAQRVVFEQVKPRQDSQETHQVSPFLSRISLIRINGIALIVVGVLATFILFNLTFYIGTWTPPIIGLILIVSGLILIRMANIRKK